MAKTITRGQAFDFEEPFAPQRKTEAPATGSGGGAGPAKAGTRRGAERGKLIRRTWVVPEDVARDFKVECAKRGLNGSDVVGSLMEEWLAGLDGE